MRRSLLIMILSALAWCSGAAAPLTTDSVSRVLDSMPLHDIEGIWQMTTDDALTIVIWRVNAPLSAPTDRLTYTVQLIKAPDRSRKPGEVLGTINPTAQPGVYDCHIVTQRGPKGVIKRTERFTVKIEDPAHLSFRPVKSGIRLSPILLVPPFLRRGIKFGSNRADDLDGAIKIYPPVPIKGCPRYL